VGVALVAGALLAVAVGGGVGVLWRAAFVLLGAALLAVAVYRVHGQAESPAKLVDPAPEATRVARPLAGAGTSATITDAVATARDEGSVEAGLAVAREPLRTALREALEASGLSAEAAEARIASGDWTDDPAIAAVIDPDCEPPPRSLRERLRAWLHPGKHVRRRVGRAADAVAATAATELPPIPGQDAPRNVPVPPTAEAAAEAIDDPIRADPDVIVPTAVSAGGSGGEGVGTDPPTETADAGANE
jgi:cobalamin biosynthesis protein CbiG